MRENVITQPKVTLVSHTPDLEKNITAAAKLCYSNLTPSQIYEKLTDEDVENFLNRILKLGHGSVLEHSTLTFAVEDISRVTETQLVRQRTGSFSVQSGRYVKRDPHYIIPEELKNDADLIAIYEESLEQSTNAYNKLIDMIIDKEIGDRSIISKTEYSKAEKKALENARYVLPQALRTHLVFSIDVRNFMNFIAHRRCKRAQDEIQEVANQMLCAVKDIMPTIYKYIGADCEITKCGEGVMTCGAPYPKKQ